MEGSKPRAKKIKDFELFDRPLPFTVINLLAGMRQVSEKLEGWPERYKDVPNAMRFDYGQHDKVATAEAEKVLQALGAAKVGYYWQFDYSPSEVLDAVVCSGCIPDQKSHQFYPTPENVALTAIELAQIEPHHGVLEPSAGQGGIADLLPQLQTTCVEISALHCDILRAKGHSTIEADFLKWAPGQPKADRIVMNPPFSEGRWQAHLEAAAALLKPDGRLVAILPASAKGKELLPGFNHGYSRIYDNEFAGTSTAVVILTATPRAA